MNMNLFVLMPLRALYRFLLLWRAKIWQEYFVLMPLRALYRFLRVSSGIRGPVASCVNALAGFVSISTA